jgi:protein arginine kinase
MGLSKNNLPLSKWMLADGPEADIVISSRIRIARNLEGVPFPGFFKEHDFDKVFHGVRLALNNEELKNTYKDLDFKIIKEIPIVDQQLLVEKHLISLQHLERTEEKALIISKEEDISIMVNEEDHLRIQSILPGLQLCEAWEKASIIDDLLEGSLNFAFHEQFGYLTACPTNTGTGLRASVMLHLPALVLTKQINRIINAISQIGLTVRGLYGEGTAAIGNIFQISNQITLGQSEIEIIEKLTAITKEIIEQERNARNNIYNQIREQLEDKVFRAYGVLKYARLISAEEIMNLLSDIRLGVDLGIIKNISLGVINELMIISRPAYLEKIEENKVEDRDVLRASIVRNILEQLEVS